MAEPPTPSDEPSEPTDEALLRAGFERVHVELDWWDGPRGGLADVAGAAHYFRAVDDTAVDIEYSVWPASAAALALEREQWRIFVAWNLRYEAGTATTDGHPGHGGIDARWDELEELLAPHRAVPEGARLMTAEWRGRAAAGRNLRDGPGYVVRWQPAGGSG
jgi:hypothetical protein